MGQFNLGGAPEQVVLVQKGVDETTFEVSDGGNTTEFETERAEISNACHQFKTGDLRGCEAAFAALDSRDGNRACDYLRQCLYRR